MFLSYVSLSLSSSTWKFCLRGVLLYTSIHAPPCSNFQRCFNLVLCRRLTARKSKEYLQTLFNRASCGWLVVAIGFIISKVPCDIVSIILCGQCSESFLYQLDVQLHKKHFFVRSKLDLCMPDDGRSYAVCVL